MYELYDMNKIYIMFFLLVLILLGFYMLLAYSMHKSNNISMWKAFKTIIRRAYRIWKENQAHKTQCNVLLDRTEWKYIGEKIAYLFYNVQFHDATITEDDIIEVVYKVNYIRPNYENKIDIVKQCIIYEFTDYISTSRGTESKLHIKVLNNEILVVQIAATLKGVHIMQKQEESIQRAIEKRNSIKYKRPKIFLHNPNVEAGRILIGFERTQLYNQGIGNPIRYFPYKSPHVLITGLSGSGKSYLLKILLKQLQSFPINIWFGDYKVSSDFDYMRGKEHFAQGEDVFSLIAEYYALFVQVKDRKVTISNMHLLIIDEYAGMMKFLENEDKNKVKEIKSMIAHMLMMGRALGENNLPMGVWLVQQRADASLFDAGGARDNAHLWIALGNQSKEAKTMFYDGDLPQNTYEYGEGVVKTANGEITEIVIPDVQNLTQNETCRDSTPHK